MVILWIIVAQSPFGVLLNLMGFDHNKNDLPSHVSGKEAYFNYYKYVDDFTVDVLSVSSYNFVKYNYVVWTWIMNISLALNLITIIIIIALWNTRNQHKHSANMSHTSLESKSGLKILHQTCSHTQVPTKGVFFVLMDTHYHYREWQISLF